VTITGGSVTLGTSLPGTATVTSNDGTFTFDVYPVDQTHLKLIENDSTGVITAGDAFTQTSSIPTNNVFTLAGFDSVNGGPFTAAGLIVTDGAGNVTSGSAEDINDNGSGDTQASFTGSYTPTSGMRSVLTLNSFNNGKNGLTGSYQFAAYPSTGGLQLLEIDDGGMTGGVAYTQNATTLATSSQGYAYNLSGVSVTTGGEEDDIAEFVNNSGTFTGRIDFNDEGSPTPDKVFSATYTADTTVPGRGTLTATSGNSTTPNLVTYVVDDSTVVAVEVDTSQVGLAWFSPQNSSSNSNAAIRNLTVMRLAAGAHRASKSH